MLQNDNFSWFAVSSWGILEKAMAPHSSTLAWKIPWTEEPGRLQSMGLLRVRHDWATSLSLFTFMHWKRKWHPLQCSCLENPRDGGAWWAAVYGVAQSRTRLKRLSSSSSSSMRHPLIKLLHLSNLLQMPNDSRMVDAEFFGNFSCSCKRISFDDPLTWSLPTNDGQLLCSSSSRLSSPLQNFLNHPCTVRSLAVPGPNMLLMFCKLSLLLYNPFWTQTRKPLEFAFGLTLFPFPSLNKYKINSK